MSLLEESAAVVEPIFDHPANLDPVSASLSVGSRVSVIYRGSPLPLQVETIERLGLSFVGRIRGAENEAPLVRFRLRDVVSID